MDKKGSEIRGGGKGKWDRKLGKREQRENWEARMDGEKG